MTTRHFILFSVLPALWLAVLGVMLIVSGRIFFKDAEHEPPSKAAFVEKLNRNEHSAERLRQFAVDTIAADESAKRFHRTSGKLLFALAAGVFFAGGLVVYGGLKLREKAQQGAPGATPPLRGGAA